MLQYFKNKYDTHFNNSIEQITIANNNLKYNQDLWQIYTDILSNIIEFMLDDFNSIHALYFTSKIFHQSIHNIKQIIINGNEFLYDKIVFPINKPSYYLNLTTISLKNFVIELPGIYYRNVSFRNIGIPLILNTPCKILDTVLKYWFCTKIELISCHFNNNTLNPFEPLKYNIQINKLYMNNVTGLSHVWILNIIEHSIIEEIIMYNSPDKRSIFAKINEGIINSDNIEKTIITPFCEKVCNIQSNKKCKINKISIIQCEVSNLLFCTLLSLLKDTHISLIDLSYNIIDKDYDNFIYDHLKKFTNLKTLNLIGNPINIDQINIWRKSNKNIEILF